MSVIWKQTLVVMEHQKVVMPANAQVLYADLQDDQVCLWYLCDGPPSVTWDIVICGTGHLVPREPRQYLGSVLQGRFVWHIWRLL